jgi:hypothetical protein
MARRGHVRRKAIFATILTLAAAARLRTTLLMSAWVHAESLPMQRMATT